MQDATPATAGAEPMDGASTAVQPVGPVLELSIGRWLTETQGFTLEEEGAYLRLLHYAWSATTDRCSLPDDERRLALIVGVSLCRFRRKLSEKALKNFTKNERNWTSPWLQELAQKDRNYRELQSLKGQKSAAARAANRSTAVARLNSESCVLDSESTPKAKTEAQTHPNPTSSSLSESSPRCSTTTTTRKHSTSALVRGVAAALRLEPQPAATAVEQFSPEKVRAKLTGLSPLDQDRLHQLAGWIWKTGTRDMAVLLELLAHAIEKRPENWFAYYAPEGAARLDLEAKALEKLAAAEKAGWQAEDQAFLGGQA